VGDSIVYRVVISGSKLMMGVFKLPWGKNLLCDPATARGFYPTIFTLRQEPLPDALTRCSGSTHVDDP